jgi:cell division protein FtsI (penicillin-binding protein 3)
MGHSVAVTPLQILSAFAVFANGGNLQRPYLVKSIVDSRGDTLAVGRPQRIRHLFGSEVVQPMRELLARVVTEGTATAAMSDAIAIAGKTGTAQKVKPSGGGYYQNKHMASFVGYFPADAPQVVGIVYLDEPRTNHFGGWTAGPALTRMAERLAVLHPEFLRYPDFKTRDALPSNIPDPQLTPGIIPNLVGLPLSRAAICASQLGYEVEVLGSGAVVNQQPRPGQSLQPGGILKLEAKLGSHTRRGRGQA